MRLPLIYQVALLGGVRGGIKNGKTRINLGVKYLNIKISASNSNFKKSLWIMPLLVHFLL